MGMLLGGKTSICWQTPAHGAMLITSLFPHPIQADLCSAQVRKRQQSPDDALLCRKATPKPVFSPPRVFAGLGHPGIVTASENRGCSVISPSPRHGAASSPAVTGL